MLLLPKQGLSVNVCFPKWFHLFPLERKTECCQATFELSRHSQKSHPRPDRVNGIFPSSSSTSFWYKAWSSSESPSFSRHSLCFWTRAFPIRVSLESRSCLSICLKCFVTSWVIQKPKILELVCMYCQLIYKQRMLGLKKRTLQMAGHAVSLSLLILSKMRITLLGTSGLISFFQYIHGHRFATCSPEGTACILFAANHCRLRVIIRGGL